MSHQSALPPLRSSSILARAQRLGAGAVLALVPLAAGVTATAASLTLDYSSVSTYSSSGYFTSAANESKADGTIINNGFKLWGQETISDSLFWRWDDREGKTVPRSGTSGLAFVWGGKIVGATTYEDRLTAPFDFTVAFTKLVPDNHTTVNTRLVLGHSDYEFAPSEYGSLPTSNSSYSDFSTSYSAAGSYHETGNVSVGLTESDGSSDRYWFALLTVDWSSEYVSGNSWDGQNYSKLNGDTLTTTIPQNSIDVTYAGANAPANPPSNSVPEAGSTAALLGLTLCGLLAVSRRR